MGFREMATIGEKMGPDSTGQLTIRWAKLRDFSSNFDVFFKCCFLKTNRMMTTTDKS